MFKFFITIFVSLLLCPALIINAQTKDSVRDKLKKLEGEASKITIQTDKGSVTLEGDEADYLLRKMKKELKPDDFTFEFPDEDFFASDDENSFNFKMDHLRIPHPPKIKFFREWDNDEERLLDNPNRKIIIEKEDGKTKVTVKRNEGDDEITETYKGEDADKYLEDLNKDEPFSLDLKNNDSGKDTRIIIIK